MSRKKGGEYQRHKERQNKVHDICGILLFLFVIAICVYGITQSAVNIHDIDHNSLNKYSGHFRYEIRRTWSRTVGYTYVFTLDNGTVLRIDTDRIDNRALLEERKTLSFQYTTMVTNPLWGGYGAMAITSADGTVEFAN